MSTFVCRRCGGCCGLAPFGKKDYKAVYRTAKNMGITFVKMNIENHVHYIPRSTARILEAHTPEEIASGSVDITCPFLTKDENGKSLCRIYDMRPEVCRLFGINKENHRYLVCPHQEVDHDNTI
jgi:Fe-S-cluster containining protein